MLISCPPVCFMMSCQEKLMDKRYQVFVSSTYTDLREARQEVMQALLELDCIPAGMELFPAADDDQWTLIKRAIDDCDYYIVIIAGRYGSIGMEGKSFTQLEYEYAVSQKKPVIAFLHKEPGKLPAENTEEDPEQTKKLNDFRDLAQKKMVNYWKTPADLGSVVSRSLIKLIKNNPAIGWVKADLLPSQDANKEILELRKKVDELEQELETVSTTAPKETAHLAQGDDEFEIKYTFRASRSDPNDLYSIPVFNDIVAYSSLYFASWSQIFARLSPLMIDEASDSVLMSELNLMTQEVNIESLQENPNIRPNYLHNFKIDNNTFNTIKVQLIALKLIAKSTKSRSVKDTHNYWKLTPYGEALMTELRAIRKDGHEESYPIASKEAVVMER